MYIAVAKWCDSKSTKETVDLNENIDISQTKNKKFEARNFRYARSGIAKATFSPCPCEVKVQGLLRIMFMSLYNDIDWSNWKRDEDVCESNADLIATCVEQFRPVRGTSVDIQECVT